MTGASLPSSLQPTHRNDRPAWSNAEPAEVGPATELVPCPICRHVALVDGKRGRCTNCTVNVKIVDGRPVAAGWRGGDFKAAGRALRYLPESPHELAPAGDACGDKRGQSAGYSRHLRANNGRGETACTPCKEAHAAATAAWKERRRLELEGRVTA